MIDVFILGAGFSKAIHSGMPSLADLTDEVTKRLQASEHSLPKRLPERAAGEAAAGAGTLPGLRPDIRPREAGRGPRSAVVRESSPS